eukprot:1974816-Pyramimonas_sp.AAC.1
MAMMGPECPIQEIFSWCAAAHAEMFRVSGASQDQVLFGRQLRPLGSQLTGSAVHLQAETEIGSSAERMVKRRAQARKAYAEALADRQACLAAVSKTRKFTTWETGEL